MAAHLAALDEAGAGDEALDARHATREEYAFMTAGEIEADLETYASGGDPKSIAGTS